MTRMTVGATEMLIQSMAKAFPRIGEGESRGSTSSASPPCENLNASRMNVRLGGKMKIQMYELTYWCAFKMAFISSPPTTSR